RPAWNPADAPPAEPAPANAPAQSPREQKRKSAEALAHHVREVAEALGPRDLDALAAFADFLRVRRAARAARNPEELEAGEDAPSSSEMRVAPVVEAK
ncbi:MAG: hypothetical protein K1X94_37035, partial [Sandaracinaceae bacterium]|nr:hypothetical protein [Sandaracinaceae bacterium]